jgi:hypothetical protein
MPIRLEIKGLGHVPSFKNNKMLARGRVITNPENQKWMERCVESFESQLICLYQTSADGMRTGRSLQSWIASVLPLDDSVREIGHEEITPFTVGKGMEGAVITITEHEKN